MAPRIHERTRDRISAVQVLYTSELTGKLPSELLDCGLCLVAREAPADETDAAEAGAFGRIEEGTLTDYALALIHGVEANQAQVDERIEAASENWALSRMPIVDRSILRLATFEMAYMDDVPVSVTINEAVDNDELLKSPRLYAPHFIDKLEKCDAVEWRDKSWRITEVGRAGQRIVADLVAAQAAPDPEAQADKAVHDAQ